MTNEVEAFPVLCVKFEKESQILIIGDQFGNIECWQMGQLIESLVFTKVEKSVLSKRRQAQSSVTFFLSLEKQIVNTRIDYEFPDNGHKSKERGDIFRRFDNKTLEN